MVSNLNILIVIDTAEPEESKAVKYNRKEDYQ